MYNSYFRCLNQNNTSVTTSHLRSLHVLAVIIFKDQLGIALFPWQQCKANERTFWWDVLATTCSFTYV